MTTNTLNNNNNINASVSLNNKCDSELSSARNDLTKQTNQRTNANKNITNFQSNMSPCSKQQNEKHNNNNNNISNFIYANEALIDMNLINNNSNNNNNLCTHASDTNNNNSSSVFDEEMVTNFEPIVPQSSENNLESFYQNNLNTNYFINSNNISYSSFNETDHQQNMRLYEEQNYENCLLTNNFQSNQQGNQVKQQQSLKSPLVNYNSQLEFESTLEKKSFLNNNQQINDQLITNSIDSSNYNYNNNYINNKSISNNNNNNNFNSFNNYNNYNNNYNNSNKQFNSDEISKQLNLNYLNKMLVKHHPRPSAVTTFNARLTENGGGYTLWNRRQDNARLILSNTFSQTENFLQKNRSFTSNPNPGSNSNSIDILNNNGNTAISQSLSIPYSSSPSSSTSFNMSNNEQYLNMKKSNEASQNNNQTIQKLNSNCNNFFPIKGDLIFIFI